MLTLSPIFFLEVFLTAFIAAIGWALGLLLVARLTERKP
jgi:hypothetical protein